MRSRYRKLSTVTQREVRIRPRLVSFKSSFYTDSCQRHSIRTKRQFLQLKTRHLSSQRPCQRPPLHAADLVYRLLVVFGDSTRRRSYTPLHPRRAITKPSVVATTYFLGTPAQPAICPTLNSSRASFFLTYFRTHRRLSVYRPHFARI
jgi:hypothetical protein